MIYTNFKIGASPYVYDAYCECGKQMIEVSDGFLSSALYCSQCENIYKLKLVKIPKREVGIEYLKQCREEAKKK